MRTSDMIRSIKDKVKVAFINNEDIVNAIDQKGITIENADELIYSNIFFFFLVPDTEDEKKTYITISVNIPQIYKWSIYKETIISIRVITHQDLMQLKNKGTRIDHISALIEDELKDKVYFGKSKMYLISNTEGYVDYRHRYRLLKFEVRDLNVTSEACWSPE